MTSIEFTGLVADGRLPRQMADRIAAVVRSLDGKRVCVSVKEVKRSRSLNQNRFYQGPFIEAIRQHLLACGHRLSHDDIHAGLRDAHAKNGYTVTLPDGLIFRVPSSTTRLTTLDFEAYLEEVRAYFATNFGWELPLPNEDN